jgi:hypothetical protein
LVAGRLIKDEKDLDKLVGNIKAVDSSELDGRGM